MRKITETGRKFIHRVIAWIVAIILRPGTVWENENFGLWEKQGYHITPAHFYSPIPNSKDIESLSLQPSRLIGINLHPEFQLRLANEFFTGYSEEYNTLPIKDLGSQGFYLDNDAFTGIDPFIYYCMIRHFRPRVVVEVGSGHSTLLGARASQLNESTQYLCIDPWPREFISRGVPGIKLIRKEVESLDLALFQQLGENDILFIDSSHVVRTGGDVCFVCLEILPRLARGVIIHFHDIYLPYDYPKDYILKQRYFWSEQYLLQAYMIENYHAEVLFASHFISKEYKEEIRKIFPTALWVGGASFWIRKR